MGRFMSNPLLGNYTGLTELGWGRPEEEIKAEQ
jgi:hypothetical protein